MFRENLRMMKHTFFKICHILYPYIHKPDSRFRPSVPVTHQVAITLWRLSSNVDFRTLGHLFNVGISTASKITSDCTKIIWLQLRDRFIRIPDGDEFGAIVSGFKERWSFPQCAGAVDGTHVPIIAPTTNSADYYNRKGFHSINLQALVDSRYVSV